MNPAKGIAGTVRCHKQILNSVSIKNDVGGTTELPIGIYRVRITNIWRDYEVGQRCVGVLLNGNDILVAKKTGTTGYTPEYYKQKYPTNPELYQDALKAASGFDPSIVYFVAEDFTPTHDQ